MHNALRWSTSFHFPSHIFWAGCCCCCCFCRFSRQINAYTNVYYLCCCTKSEICIGCRLNCLSIRILSFVFALELGIGFRIYIFLPFVKLRFILHHHLILVALFYFYSSFLSFFGVSFRPFAHFLPSYLSSSFPYTFQYFPSHSNHQLWLSVCICLVFSIHRNTIACHLLNLNTTGWNVILFEMRAKQKSHLCAFLQKRLHFHQTNHCLNILLVSFSKFNFFVSIACLLRETIIRSVQDNFWIGHTQFHILG